jgi:hypothetical protein
MLFLSIAFGMWSLIYRSSASTLRVENARLHRDARSTWTAPALAMGLRALETGVPPPSSLAYKVTVTEAGETRYFRLTFEEVTPTRYTITCEPSDEDDISPDLPASFS